MSRRAAQKLPPLLASLASRRAREGEAGAGSAKEDAPPAAAPERRGKAGAAATRKKKVKAKAQKGAPLEVSSRRPVQPPRRAKAKRNQPRDPRFDDFSGSLDVDMFRKSYSFIEEYREEELQSLKEQADLLKRRREDPDEDYDELDEALVDRITSEVRRRVRQDKQRRHLGDMRAAELQLKREEREKVRATGKTPYFHKRADVRQLVRQARQKERKGGRDKQEERREKKVAARGMKKLPQRRQGKE
mmetsp:Transcript_74813/g.223064  ORF Transcript_74813/g.223064 Transcript_74813/m.223064 type:complete len:246 (-) Transcript_74813:6-743(-)